MKLTWIFLMLLVANGAVAESGGGAVKTVENLTLEHAIEMAERLQPQLAEAKALVDAAEGRARQAGFFPNPEAIVGAQQLAISGSQANEKEYVAGVAQTVPLSSRLGKARQAALMEREVRARELEVRLLEIRKGVRRAFATALYQERARQARNDLLRDVEKLVEVTRARVQAGDALAQDLAQVEMERSLANVEFQRAESMREQALTALAASIGDASIVVHSLSGSLESALNLPELETLAADLKGHPEQALADADTKARGAVLNLAKAERIPDVKIELLYHRLEAARADTIDLGLSIPLPLFNRNKGRVLETQADEAAAEARARITQTDLAVRFREANLRLRSALGSARAMNAEILPRARIVLASGEARYKAGDLSLSEILPLRRNWASIELAYLESLRDAMEAWGDLKSLAR